MIWRYVSTYTVPIRANNIILLYARIIKLVRGHRLPIDRSVAGRALARVCKSCNLRMRVCSVHNIIIIYIYNIYRVGKRTEAAEFECGPTV